MTFELYKNINLRGEETKEEILKQHNGCKVIIKDAHSGNILVGGKLQYSKGSDIYYLTSKTARKGYHVNDLEQLIFIL